MPAVKQNVGYGGMLSSLMEERLGNLEEEEWMNENPNRGASLRMVKWLYYVTYQLTAPN
jgi:hypothetical protein